MANVNVKTIIDTDKDIEFRTSSTITNKFLLKDEYTIPPIKIEISLKSHKKITIVTAILIKLLIGIII